MNDRELQQFVIDELEFDPSIDAADIGVAAENGVVTLTGHVSTYVQKLAAERAAWRVKGVRAIAQEITVRLPTDKKTNDDEIANSRAGRRIVHRLTDAGSPAQQRSTAAPSMRPLRKSWSDSFARSS